MTMRKQGFGYLLETNRWVYRIVGILVRYELIYYWICLDEDGAKVG